MSVLVADDGVAADSAFFSKGFNHDSALAAKVANTLAHRGVLLQWMMFKGRVQLAADCSVPKKSCVNMLYIANEVLMFFRSKRKTAQDIYISDPIDTDKEGNSLSLMDIVADEDNIFDNLDLKIQSEKLHLMIQSLLEEREKTIVLMRYGLCGYVPMTQREVAKKLGISRSYVSRIEKKALGVLRKEFDKTGS